MCGAVQYGYRMAKAALNIAGATLARDLKSSSVSVALIHPGVVCDGSLALNRLHVTPRAGQNTICCCTMSMRQFDQIHSLGCR